jgi:hypothetical protein
MLSHFHSWLALRKVVGCCDVFWPMGQNTWSGKGLEASKLVDLCVNASHSQWRRLVA